ncbi:NUC189-domain-containing protein [Backusella circina FSU 941]|nr:NUC189-domain-containing protein [Backusella circina FSU 941]
MTKKSSTKVSPRRGSIVDKDNIKMVDDHSKYSIQYEELPNNKTNHDELKAQASTPEEMRDLVRRLPLDAVLPLLSELLEKFNHSRDTEVTAWLKTVLLIHTGYFMTLPDVVKKLSQLYKSLNTDLEVYPKLLSMRGRLDLVQGQIDARYRQNEDDEDMEEDDDEEEMGQDTYNESESSDDDEEGDALLSDDEDIEMNTTEMFAEEEDDLNTEDEDASDSDIEEE